jgi:hypothetical protein
MTRTITDIRPVGIAPHLHLIADVKEENAVLGYSVEIDELTADELITYAVTDPAHIQRETLIADSIQQIEATYQATDITLLRFEVKADEQAERAERAKALQIVLDNSFTPEVEPWNEIPDADSFLDKPAWMIEAEAQAADAADLFRTQEDARF